MMTNKRRFTVLSTLVLAVVFLAQSQESYKLQYKFQKGTTLLYRSVTNNDITQEMQGQEMKIVNDSRAVVRLAVDDVHADGNAVLVASSDSMVTHSKNPMVDTTMVMNNMIGKRIKITVSPIGKVESREVIDSVKLDMAGMNTRTPQREPMNIWTVPEKTLKVGDTWKDARTDTMDIGTGKVVTATDVDYTLAGKESRGGRECLKITYAGKLTTSGKMNRMGMDIFTEGSGKIAGTLFFDHAKGVLVQDESVRDVESTIAVTGQQNMTIPMTTSTKTSLQLIEN